VNIEQSLWGREATTTNILIEHIWDGRCTLFMLTIGTAKYNWVMIILTLLSCEQMVKSNLFSCYLNTLSHSLPLISQYCNFNMTRNSNVLLKVTTNLLKVTTIFLSYC
jgi:hypothetical protein